MNFHNDSLLGVQGFPYYQQQPSYFPNPYQNSNPFHGGLYSSQVYPYPHANYNLPLQQNTQQNMQQNIPVNQGPTHFGPQNPYRPQGPAFFNAFTGPDGKFDVSKTFQTVDQVVKTVNQISPLVKSVSSFFTTTPKV